ncbi:hypothetical protein [Actinomadura macrotermitis]|uniref:Scramblase n=1 Tax=Actinomadura macrotermitis TaxID=2585200 RepID=A0A7K0BSX9_9ACTN|nr:hypothetical protein [Actinomadura macrotermitis]MQY04305.1 hypothetical protein [Actinomadura macrotermitis]
MSTLYTAPLLRVHKGSVTDAHGTPLATVRDRGGAGWRGALDAVNPGAASGFARAVDVLDPWNRPLFAVARDSSHLRRAVTHVLRPDGAQLGSVGMDSRRGRPFYPIHDPYGTHVGEVRPVGPRKGAGGQDGGAGVAGLAGQALRKAARGVQSLVFGGTFDITDRIGTVHGRIDCEWPATKDEPYTVAFQPGTPEPLRFLGLASALALDVVRGLGS